MLAKRIASVGIFWLATTCGSIRSVDIGAARFVDARHHAVITGRNAMHPEAITDAAVIDWEGDGAMVIRHDARDLPLADASVDLVVTSPP